MTWRVREPEIEDNEIQADERMRRALAVAVDADWVEKESRKPNVRVPCFWGVIKTTESTTALYFDTGKC